MNIYQKLNKVRVELQEMELKKSGRNTYSNFTYYELADILPAINKVCDKNGLFIQFSIIDESETEHAVLTIYNVDKTEEMVEFVAPTAEAQIGVKRDGTGGADPIQNLGGKITYMRRYMLLTAFEIVESDMVDAVNKKLVKEVSVEDKKYLEESKDLKELSTRAKKLLETYEPKIITPIYNKVKQDITAGGNQDENI